MGTNEKFGVDWEPDEINRVVAAYFEMLDSDLKDVRVNKAARYREISSEIGRTEKSVELKFQNISAVLDKLEEPWIRGLAPRVHYQYALLVAIDSYLTSVNKIKSINQSHNFVFDEEQSGYEYQSDAKYRSGNLSFVPAPQLSHSESGEKIPAHMRDLIKKFDPVLRDMRARKIGDAGEKLVFDFERKELIRLGRPDLASKVLWVSKELGDGAGYDVKSYKPDGRDKFIEVKTTVGSHKTPFFMSRNEKEFADSAGARYRVTRIFDFRRKPLAFELTSPLSAFVRFEPEIFRASFS